MNMNNGYSGYSMSQRAVMAYQGGEKPISKWTKAEIISKYAEQYEPGLLTVDYLKTIPVKVLKSVCLRRSSYHHTSIYCNATDFYSLANLSELTKGQFETYLTFERTEQAEPEKWECSYLVWTGTRKHPKATEHRAVGEIKGNYFYPDGESYKKLITANGFRKIKRIG